jgi:hypothetical protein
MLRVRLVGFQHALEDIERGMLELLESLGRFLLHVRRRATVKTADSAMVAGVLQSRTAAASSLCRQLHTTCRLLAQRAHLTLLGRNNCSAITRKLGFSSVRTRGLF